jgi:WD40 repeat protein
MEHRDWIMDIKWNKGDKSNLLLSAGFDFKVILWDIKKEKPV